MQSYINGRWEKDVGERQKRVMIIDDASLVRRFYRAPLEAAGFVVDEALNGLEAMEKLLQAPDVDLLIVDINMPQMDGITFLNKLRARTGPEASIPALITSTEAGVQDVDAARAAGANFYLTKPVKQPALVEFAKLKTGTATT